MNPVVLAIEHEPDDPPARFGLWLEDAGCRLHVRQPWAGEELPADLDGYAGMLVMGGWMSAHHDAEVAWLAGVKQLTRRAAVAGVPTLGICLGHQVAAVALGGTVARAPRQQVGLYDVGWLPAAAQDPLFSAVVGPGRGIHWNYDVVTGLPAGGHVLARAVDGQVQAARHAPTVWGVQWHPEVDEPLVRRWAADDAVDPATLPVDLEDTLAAVAAARGELDRTWRPLAARFATLATAATRGSGHRR